MLAGGWKTAPHGRPLRSPRHRRAGRRRQVPVADGIDDQGTGKGGTGKGGTVFSEKGLLKASPAIAAIAPAIVAIAPAIVMTAAVRLRMS